TEQYFYDRGFMNQTKISWTSYSWNVWSGCEQISPGCGHCYALEQAEKYRGSPGFPRGFDLTFRWHRLDDPLRMKKPARIFANSMSDMFYEGVSDEDIQRV